MKPLFYGVLSSLLLAGMPLPLHAEMPPASNAAEHLAGAELQLEQQGREQRVREYPGVLYPLHDIALSMGVSGLVAAVPVKLGDEVQQGQLILQLDDSAEKIEADRREVILKNRAELESLEKQIERTSVLVRDNRRLYKKSGSVSRDEVVRMELEYFSLQGRYEKLKADKARERLEFAAAQQARTMRSLHAPMQGHITMLEVDSGEWVTPGTTLMQLMDTSALILRLAVPEQLAQQLKPGDMVPLRFEAYATIGPVSGEIRFVSVAADPASSLVKVEIGFDNTTLGIRPGGKGYALFSDTFSFR